MKKRHRRKVKIDLFGLSSIDIYTCLLRGEIAKFPNNFVTRDNMKEIIRYVILTEKKLSRKEICDKISFDYLAQYKLKGSRHAFDYSIFELVKYCFPELDIKNWELKKVSNNFWKEEKNIIEYMNWLVEKEKIDTTKISDLKKIDANLIDKNFGRKARQYSNGIYNLILIVSKIDVKEWQVMNVSKWDDIKAAQAIKWLVEEKLKWSDNDIAQKMNVKVFEENDLGGLIKNYFRHNVINALNLTYPGKFIRNSSYKIELV